MKQSTFVLGIVIGMFIISGSFVVKHYWPDSDFIEGFMKGCGFAIMLVVFFNRYRLRHS